MMRPNVWYRRPPLVRKSAINITYLQCHTILGMMYLSQQNPKIEQRPNPLFGLESAIELMIDKLSLKNNRRVLAKRRSISGERRTATATAILFYISNLSEMRFH